MKITLRMQERGSLALLDDNGSVIAHLERSSDGAVVVARTKLSASVVARFLFDVVAERDEARAAVAELEARGSPGVLHEVDQAFYDLTVKERDLERKINDRLRARVAELKGAIRGLTDWCEDAIENQDACGDRDRECPMHDAHKDWSLAGLVAKARTTLGEEE